MNFILTRKSSSAYGILGELRAEDDSFVCCTLEHAYPELGGFSPKTAPGTYTCVRHPPRRLHYETFELTNVPPFQTVKVDEILIHIGNYNKDSEGCILLGEMFGTGCILESRAAFEKFMDIQSDVNEFILVIR